jgi:hypothetical protein
MPFPAIKSAIANLLNYISITPRLLYYIGLIYYAKGYNIISFNIVS